MNWLQRIFQPQNMLAGVPVATNPQQTLALETAFANQGDPAFQMPAQAPAQPQQPGLMDRLRGFRDSDRGQFLADMFAGWAMGQTPNQSLGYGAMMAAQGRKDRNNRNQTIEWLKAQGVDESQASALAGNPQALQHYLIDMMKKNDPAYQLDMDYRRAQIAKLQREMEGGGQAELGLNPQYGVDKDGNPVLIQIGKDGKAVQTAMPEGVQLSKEPIKMDAGTHFVLLDPITRQPVGQIPKENYQEAFEKGAGSAAGKAQGEAAANLPTDLATADQAIKDIDALIEHKGLSAIAGPLDQYRPAWMMGAEGRDALARFNQAKGRAFLQAYGMLKGGGQITEVEGVKAEQAMARMDRALNEEDFKEALKDFRDAVKAGAEKLKQRAGVPTQQPVSIGGYTIEQVD